MPEVGTQHVFGAGGSTRCVGGNPETAVFPGLGLVAFTRGGPSGDEHGRMLDVTHLHRDPFTRMGRIRFLNLGAEKPRMHCGRSSDTSIPGSEVVLAAGDHSARHHNGGADADRLGFMVMEGAQAHHCRRSTGAGAGQPWFSAAAVLISSTYWFRVILATVSLVTSWITRGPGCPGLKADRRVV